MLDQRWCIAHSRGSRNSCPTEGDAARRTVPEQLDAVGRLAHEFMCLLFHLRSPRGQLLAFAGQYPAARQPVEQVQAQRLFELGYAARNRRMFDPQAAGSRGEAAGACERKEYPDIVPVNFHRCIFARKVCRYC